MRKLCFTVIVVLMAAAANAGMVDVVISSLNGQPITPVKEITIKPGDWITFDVVYIGDPGWYLYEMISMVYVEPNNPVIGHLSITDPDTGQNVVTWPSGFWDRERSNVWMYNERIYINTDAADLYTVPPGIVLDHLLYQCSGLGDVFIKNDEDYNTQCCFSHEIYKDELYPVWYGPGLVVHQVYEPACWDCPWQPEGDANGDGEIDVVDYFLFRKAYGTGWNTHPHGTGVGQYNCCCDFNHDGKVDSADYFPIRINWKKVFAPCANISCQ